MTRIILAAAVVGLLAIGASQPLAAQPAGQPPLTQADIDAYVYLLPFLAAGASFDSEEAARALADSGLSRRRAAFVGAKMPFVQAVVEGQLKPEALAEAGVPDYLQPTAAELMLVGDNLETIKKAQAATLDK